MLYIKINTCPCEKPDLPDCNEDSHDFLKGLFGFNDNFKYYDEFYMSRIKTTQRQEKRKSKRRKQYA